MNFPTRLALKRSLPCAAALACVCWTASGARAFQRIASPVGPAPAGASQPNLAALTRQPADELMARRNARRAGPGLRAKPGVARATTPEERQALEHEANGVELFTAGRYEQAAAEFGEALRIQPGVARHHNNLGSAHAALGRVDEAFDSFRLATDIDPRFALAHFNLGLMHLKRGREPEGREALGLAARFFLEGGDAHLAAGRLAEAEESFRGLLVIIPQYYAGRLRVGLVRAAARRHKEAAQIFRQLAREEPERHEAHQHLGESLYELGRHKEALSSLQQAAGLRPATPEIHYLLGKTHLKLGRPDLALAEYHRLRELKDEARAETLRQLIGHEPEAPQR